MSKVIVCSDRVILACGHRNFFVRRRDIPVVVEIIDLKTKTKREELAKSQRCFHCGKTTKERTAVYRA